MKTEITETKKEIIVGFLGPAGSFSEEAAQRISADKYLPFSTIPELLRAFWMGKIDKIILPIDNSIEGIVNHAIDGLITEKNGNNFSIEEEIILPINQNLISAGEISEIKKVVSHPHALAQCADFIEKLGIEAESFSSTSAAVKLVAESNNPEIAAIGTRRAAEVYGLEVLAESIQDFKNNVTRFIVLGHGTRDLTGSDKTSLIFEVKDKPGALFKVLEVFAVLGINMTKIVSRPLKMRIDDYIFWVDIEGHQEDTTINVALGRVKERTRFLKILGSYPKSNLEV